MALVTAWVALDDVTLDNGCMWVVPGSQRNGALDHSEPWKVGGRLDMRIPDSAIDEAKSANGEQPITMRAGGWFLPPLPHPASLRAQQDASLPAAAWPPTTWTARSRWTGAPAEKPDYPLLAGREYPGCV